jgi:phage host-nuclease inhibitor protein Gam
MSDELEPLYQDEADPAVRSGGWTIQTNASLEWSLGRLAAIRAEITDIEEATVQAVQRIHARRDYLIGKAQHGISFFTAQIARYASEKRNELLGGSNRKSRVMLHGTIGWRKRAGRLVVVDEAALKAWLTDQNDVNLYRVKVEPEMKALQELYAQTGQIPPGMEYQVEQEKFYVEPVDLNESLVKP